MLGHGGGETPCARDDPASTPESYTIATACAAPATTRGPPRGFSGLVVEAGPRLLDRASRVNQARIHNGFYYPRSALTAVKSMLLYRRFVKDFSEAVVDDFQILYAIARRRSRVSAKRFYRMFRDMGAPIQTASPRLAALFDDDRIEAAFTCTEAAFDYTVLCCQLEERLAREGVEVRLNTYLETLEDREGGIVAGLSDDSEVSARFAFNITYAQINDVLDKARLPRARLKHELAEIALVEPPEEFAGLGVTVMDGPFLSCMPYPAEGLYSLIHVRCQSASNRDALSAFNWDPYRGLKLGSMERSSR